MKKKIICLTALLILSAMMLSSCITQMFGEAGITQPPETTRRPGIGDVTTAPETESANHTPAYGSKPSYAGLKLSDYIYTGMISPVPATLDRATAAAAATLSESTPCAMGMRAT